MGAGHRVNVAFTELRRKRWQDVSLDAPMADAERLTEPVVFAARSWAWTKKQRKHKLKPVLGLTNHRSRKLSPGHAACFGITTIPTLIDFKNGQPVTTLRDVQSKSVILKSLALAA